MPLSPDAITLSAEILLVLSHEKRLEIMQYLFIEEKTVGQMTELVSLELSVTSKHLTKLKAVKLVSSRRAGMRVHYKTDSVLARKLMAALKQLEEES